jgi:hypothetical protein
VTTPTTPPLSPDGTHWWDGAVWVPLAPAAPQAPYPGQQPYAGQPDAGQPYATPQYAPGYPPQPAYGAPYLGSAPASTTSGLAIASLVLGILWVFGVGSLVALILGLVARARIRNSGGTIGGQGLATAGTALGGAGLGLTVLLTVMALPTVHAQQHRVARAEVASTLRNAAVAEESFFTENGTYTDSVPALVREGLDPAGVQITVLSASETGYCLFASDGRQTLWFTNEGFSPLTRPCG